MGFCILFDLWCELLKVRLGCKITFVLTFEYAHKWEQNPSVENVFFPIFWAKVTNIFTKFN